jgi:hypothetical protein
VRERERESISSKLMLIKRERYRKRMGNSEKEVGIRRGDMNAFKNEEKSSSKKLVFEIEKKRFFS